MVGSLPGHKANILGKTSIHIWLQIAPTKMDGSMFEISANHARKLGFVLVLP